MLSVHYRESVWVTFHEDGIAQEPNEIFQLTLALHAELSPREGLFLRDAIQMTVIDHDSKDCRHSIPAHIKISCIILDIEVLLSKDSFQD